MSSPVLVGYFAKRRTPSPDWLRAPGVREICSVSECIAKGPNDWIEAWLHNAWGAFNTPAAAWSVVPPGQLSDFHLLAYEVHPAVFVQGSERPLEVRVDDVASRDSSFNLLGFDIVSSSSSGVFECSPLSCNRWAEKVGANAWCLLDDPGEALRLASIAEASGCEPGDYYVVSVWRGGSDV